MDWKTDTEWEEKEDIVRAVSSDKSLEVYYIVDIADSLNDWNTENRYLLNYWPNKRKKIETVSLIDSFDELEDALTLLGEKTDSSVV